MLSSARLLQKHGHAAGTQKIAVAAMGVRITLYLIAFSAEETQLAEEIEHFSSAHCRSKRQKML